MDRKALTRNIVIAMVAGLVIGSIIHELDLAAEGWFMGGVINGFFDVVGQIFIRSLKLLVVPLVFFSLVCGASNLSDGGSMGRIGLKTMGLYLMTTAVAITLALLVAIAIDPGRGIDLAATSDFTPRESPSLKQVVINIFPSNPVHAMAEGFMLQVIVFAILVGVAINKCGEAGARVRQSMLDWNEVMMSFILMIMLIAPFGVFALMITLFAKMGAGVVFDLAKYFFTVAFVLLLHFAGTFSVMMRFMARLSPLKFYRKMAPVMAYAFSTSSSSATMPVTLDTVRTRIGVKNEVASFTVPLGATINMDGTAIMQGVATVFIAGAFNIDIGFQGYLLVIATATLASIGAAGVPGVGLITLALVLEQVGLPVEGIALIIGVDRLLDMMRTAVNVTGDATVSAIVARSERKLDDEIFEADPRAEAAAQ